MPIYVYITTYTALYNRIPKLVLLLPFWYDAILYLEIYFPVLVSVLFYISRRRAINLSGINHSEYWEMPVVGRPHQLSSCYLSRLAEH